MILTAGVDEAGRGPLAGPVVACAVILKRRIVGLKDSKKLTENQRLILSDKIKSQALAWSVGSASVTEIDRLNILQASLLAMQRAIQGLSIAPSRILVDGNCLPNIDIPAKAIIDGDNLIPSISAASIIAKVTRDQLMTDLDKQYPEYGFAKHKGYGTAEHLHALLQHGISPIHRLSFAPVKKLVPEMMVE